MTLRTGFIGLGNQGKPIAAHRAGGLRDDRLRRRRGADGGAGRGR
ncbi:MAG: hypothetical protein R3E53_10400 [Myxococcota bacterium]